MQRESIVINKQARLQKIADQLKIQKQFQVTNINAGGGQFGDIMFVNNGYYDLAIKVISLYDGVDSMCENKLAEAKKEAKILSECNQFHVVKYHSEFQINNNYFIVMEKCQMSLQDWVDRNKNKLIDKQLFIKFALEILTAVDFLHSKGYVLRDLALKNILIDKDLTIKLCDFGLAKRIDPSQVSKTIQASEIKGTILYLPPEIIQMSQNSSNKIIQNKEADIWATGICLYALAGAEFQHIISLALGTMNFQYQQHLGSEINQILQLLLKRNPNERPKIQQVIGSFFNLANVNDVFDKKSGSKVKENQQKVNYFSLNFTLLWSSIISNKTNLKNIGSI